MTRVTTTDCRSFDGVTVGLIDSIITAARVLKHRDKTSPDVQEALADLRDDQDVAELLGSDSLKIKILESEKADLQKIVDRLAEDANKSEPEYPIAHPTDDFTGDHIYQYDTDLFIWYTLKQERRMAKSLKLAKAHRKSHLECYK